MQLSIVVVGLAVLLAMLVTSGDARVLPSSDEILDELTENLLARYLESRSLDRNVQRINTPGQYYDGPGPVRRLRDNPNSSTHQGQSSSNTNTENSGGNNINGGVSAGTFQGFNQGRR